MPFIKMLNFLQSAYMASSWIKNKNVTNFPKIHDFWEIYRNYSARGLIVKYV